MRRDPNFKEENTLKHRPFEMLAKVHVLKPCEPRKGPVHELGDPPRENPISEGLRRSFEIANGREVCVAVDRAAAPSDTVKVTRNGKGEFVRAEYYSDSGELVAVEDALDVKFEKVIWLEPQPGAMKAFDELTEKAQQECAKVLLGASALAPKDCKP